MIKNEIKEGLSTTFTKEALTSNTIYHTGTSEGVLDYLVSTTAVIELIIEISSEMLNPLLPDDYITVGKKIELSHEKATLLGEPLTFALKVAKIEGENIFLDITVNDSIGVVCRGKYERVIVNKEELISNAYKRSAK